MTKILKRIKGYLPVSRREHLEAIKNIKIILDGFQVAETQHSRIEQKLITDMLSLKQVKTTKRKQAKGKKDEDVAFA